MGRPTLSVSCHPSHKFNTSSCKSGFVCNFHCPAFCQIKRSDRASVLKKTSSQQQIQSLRIPNVLFLFQCQWIWTQQTSNRLHSFVCPSVNSSARCLTDKPRECYSDYARFVKLFHSCEQINKHKKKVRSFEIGQFCITLSFHNLHEKRAVASGGI